MCKRQGTITCSVQPCPVLLTGSHPFCAASCLMALKGSELRWTWTKAGYLSVYLHTTWSRLTCAAHRVRVSLSPVCPERRSAGGSSCQMLDVCCAEQECSWEQQVILQPCQCESTSVQQHAPADLILQHTQYHSALVSLSAQAQGSNNLYTATPRTARRSKSWWGHPLIQTPHRPECPSPHRQHG